MRRSKLRKLVSKYIHNALIHVIMEISQVLNENARKPLSIGYLAFSLCSDILAVLSVF